MKCAWKNGLALRRLLCRSIEKKNRRQIKPMVFSKLERRRHGYFTEAMTFAFAPRRRNYRKLSFLAVTRDRGHPSIYGRAK